jgi:hypothetical protein
VTIIAEEAKLIAATIRETADGPLYEDWEFHTLFGFEREEMRALALAWDREEISQNALHAGIGAFGNLLGYPHGERGRVEFLKRVGCTKAEAQTLLDKLLSKDNQR